MKQILGICLVMVAISISPSFAQSSVGIGVAANYMNVVFENSQGIRNQNLKGLPGAGAFVTYEKAVDSRRGAKFQKNILCSLGYRTSGFKDKSSQVLTTWSVNFLETLLAMKVTKESKALVNPCFHAGIVHNYLISGSQARGFEQYDLSQFLRRHAFNVTAGFGVSYKISDINRCGLVFSYSRGLTNMERDANQNARFHVFQLAASVSFGMKSKKNEK